MADIVAGVIKKGDGYLLIKKGKGPYIGMWSVPSGRIKKNESAEAACLREMKEETNLDVVPRQKIFSAPAHLDSKATIHYFLCEAKNIEAAKPGSDASDLKFFTRAMALQLDLSPMTKELLEVLKD